jgi:hypothetical protein
MYQALMERQLEHLSLRLNALEKVINFFGQIQCYNVHIFHADSNPKAVQPVQSVQLVGSTGS